MWGMLLETSVSLATYKSILSSKRNVSLEEAVFRSEKAFRPSNLQSCLQFWEEEILMQHPQKQTLLGWLMGVKIEDYLNSFTEGNFQGIPMHSYYPEPQQFENYVPSEFEGFMDTTVQQWVQLGMLKEWSKVRKSSDPYIPLVVSPLGVEPSKPRALWDGRYVNEFCRDIPFTMDNAARVAEVAWENVYFFKIDHKNGYQHVPIHESSWIYFGVFWKGIYYVFAVLPFGWKTSPYIYHTLTEAVAMYLRSLQIPMVVWIDDMFGMTRQLHRYESDEIQFQSALKAMVVSSMVLYLAGYFLGISKCFLIPEKIMTYLGIECDSLRSRFAVPEERIHKYLPLLQDLLLKNVASYLELEKIVGKLVSLECAVPAGMWYTREQYSALRLSGLTADSKKSLKKMTIIYLTESVREEFVMWIQLLQQNKGAPWKQYSNVYVRADVASDASGRSFAGVVSLPDSLPKIVAGEFEDNMLNQDIQVKEGEALRQTLIMVVKELPQLIVGKTLVCKVDNQALKAIIENKGSTRMLPLNAIGKQIFWLQQLGDFFLQLEYIKSELNISDRYTRQSPGLEASISSECFRKIWTKYGPFDWDLMATTANVNKDPQGNPLFFFSRYYDLNSKGVNVFSQQLKTLTNLFCFPPFPVIGMFLKFLQQQKVICVLVVPAVYSPWRNLLEAHTVSGFLLSEPFDKQAFTITHPTGRRVPKLYPHAMMAVLLDFLH